MYEQSSEHRRSEMWTHLVVIVDVNCVPVSIAHASRQEGTHLGGGFTCREDVQVKTPAGKCHIHQMDFYSNQLFSAQVQFFSQCLPIKIQNLLMHEKWKCKMYYDPCNARSSHIFPFPGSRVHESNLYVQITMCTAHIMFVKALTDTILSLKPMVDWLSLHCPRSSSVSRGA